MMTLSTLPAISAPQSCLFCRDRTVLAQIPRRPLSPATITVIETTVDSTIWAELYYQWGNALHSQEELAKAVQAYQYVLNLNPRHAPSLINQGLTLLERGQFDKATDNFKAILNLPDDVVVPASLHAIAHYNLAIIYKRRGETSLAIRSVQAALTVSPNFSRAKLFLQQLQEPSHLERR